jgi:hypothetical protein
MKAKKQGSNNKKGLYVGGVIALVLAGVAGSMWCRSAVIAPAPSLAVGYSSYANADLHFGIEIPSSADVMTAVGSMDEAMKYEREELGRIGATRITEEKTVYTQPDPMVVVHVYSAINKLERDFGAKTDVTMEASMKTAGLTKSSGIIDGVTASIYSGVHEVDGIGGSKYDYVAGEVMGSTYAYFIEFENMGTNPNSAQIQRYLASFETN